MKIPTKSRCLPHLDNSPVQKQTVPLHGSLGGLAVSYMMPAVPKPSWHPVPAAAHAAALMSVVWNRRGMEDIAAGCTCMNNQAVALSTHMHAFTLPFSHRQCFEPGHGQQSGLAGQEVAARRPGHHPLTCSHRVPTSPSRSCFSCSTICFSSYSCSSCISSCRSCVGGDNPSHAQSPAAPCQSPTSWQGTATATVGTRAAPGRGWC